MATSVPMLAAATAPRPDLLLIKPDPFRSDCLSAVGNPVVRTPNLDALAADGALFRRAYSTAPSCIPLRHALLTGQAPQTSGIVGYALRPLRVRPLPELLAQFGYTTVLVGRNMHQAPERGSFGYQRQLLGSTYVAGDDYDRDLISAAPASGGIRKIVETLRLDNKRIPHKSQIHLTAGR